MRRVVVTGMGMVSPLASGVLPSWNRLINSESGINAISSFDVSDLPAKIAGQVEVGELDGQFMPDNILSAKERRRVDDFIIYGLAAAQEAVVDSGWLPDKEEDQIKTGVLIGSGIGGLPEIARGSLTVDCESGGGVRRLSPFFIPASLINLISGHVSIKYKFQGPNHAVVTACSTGAHAIGDAARLIIWEDADVMVAGGSEAACCRIGMAGFSQAKALSTQFNNMPEKASRPWDRDRDGFVMGEGAGIVVLEELEHALKRNAKIYAEVVGYGATSDGYDMVAPSGEGGERAIRSALATVDSKVDYINAHGTSTPAGDPPEISAIRRVFGDNVPKISSTKSLSGHSLGAAGVHEAIYSLLMLDNDFIAGSANIFNKDPDIEEAPIVTSREDDANLVTVMSNSFGFGGTNAVLVFRKV